MQVTFKAPQKLGNKPYKVGLQIIPDHLAGNQKFKALVKAGIVVVHPRDANAQKVQASKDAENVKKADIARRLSAKLGLQRQNQVRPHEIAAGVKGQKTIAKKAQAAAPAPSVLKATPPAAPAPVEAKK